MGEGKNMYEQWRDKELPEDFQKSIDSRCSFESGEERIFLTGFLVGRSIDAIRKAQGIEE